MFAVLKDGLYLERPATSVKKDVNIENPVVKDEKRPEEPKVKIIPIISRG